MTKLTYTRDGVEYACDVESLPAPALAYLLQYGWAQSLQDCIAGRAKVVRDEMAGQGEAAIAAAVQADIAGTLAKRADAIKTGTVAKREGKSTGHSKPFLGVAREMLAAVAKARGLTMPKAKAYAELLERFIAARRGAIQAEVERRAATVAVDLDF